MKTVSEFGDFSHDRLHEVGLGEPREVRAGVVDGTYFEVMGLHPVLGRLLDPRDDGPNAAGAVVLTYRFWSDVLKSDPTVIGKTVIRLGMRARDDRGSAGTVGAVSGGDRDHGERRDQPASSVGDDGDRASASHDGTFRPPRAGREFGAGAR